MNLGKEQKMAYRRSLEKGLKNYNGDRVSIPPELSKTIPDFFEQLIFDEVSYKNDEGEIVIVKFPVWTPSCLKHLDLSHISFEGVLLNPGAIFGSEDICINFSGTNVSIDFSKLVEPVLSNCNFSGVDLSSSTFSSLKEVGHCDFSNSKLNINSDILSVVMIGSDFSNVDFDGVEVAFENVIDCNLVNTGINISVGDVGSPMFVDMMNDGLLDGCYINGKDANDCKRFVKKFD